MLKPSRTLASIIATLLLTLIAPFASADTPLRCADELNWAEVAGRSEQHAASVYHLQRFELALAAVKNPETTYTEVTTERIQNFYARQGTAKEIRRIQKLSFGQFRFQA